MHSCVCLSIEFNTVSKFIMSKNIDDFKNTNPTDENQSPKDHPDQLSSFFVNHDDNDDPNVAREQTNDNLVGPDHKEKDHNSNPKVDYYEQYSVLTREQLISELIDAREKIQDLELQKYISRFPSSKSSHHHERIDVDIDASASEDSFYTNVCYVMTDMQVNLDNLPSSEQNPLHDNSHKNKMSKDFIIAYEHRGTFPPCDQDLIISTDVDEFNENGISEMMVFDDYDNDNDNYLEETWEKYSEATTSSISTNSEEFPLIPSPVLDTPPYEYIFLTRDNEAKFRIFLNQKLNKVFQEELQKLQKQSDQNEEEWKLENDEESTKNRQNNSVEADADGDSFVTDANKQSHHLKEESSLSIKSFKSVASNVIHCFDPSDVDIELRKIFTSKPPITHKIVRRKSRKERGSSVAAVDSYYGTSDLNKVGHASYFIPTLTDSERKAIGWKPDYHFGHWKYSALNVPNIRNNPISLHPHPHLDNEHSSRSKHGHHHRHHYPDALLSQNPIHQQEINYSDPFLNEDQDETPGESPKVVPTGGTAEVICTCKNEIHNRRNSQDSLSYITLSGCSEEASSHSCHIIPNKCALLNLLHWIMPSCTKNPGVTTSNISESLTLEDNNNLRQANLQNRQIQTRHEIETIVEAPDKLTFPVSHTHISFKPLDQGTSLGKSTAETFAESRQTMISADVGNNNGKNKSKHSHHQHIVLNDGAENDSRHRHRYTRSHHYHNRSHSRENHQQQKPHSHHHGLFHWKNVLHHGSKNKDSMSVIGGDVLDSNEGSCLVPQDIIKADALDKEDENENGSNRDTEEKRSDQNSDFNHVNIFNENVEDEVNSLTEESEPDETGEKKKVFKKSKKLKPCKAYARILTLNDLGYN